MKQVQVKIPVINLLLLVITGFMLHIKQGGLSLDCHVCNLKETVIEEYERHQDSKTGCRTAFSGLLEGR